MHAPGLKRWTLVPLALVLLTATSAFAAPANAPQIGGATCSAAMVNGTYFYLLTGINATGGTAAPYAEFGQLVANGSGGISGQTSTNLSGQRGTYPMTGTYTVQPNCNGRSNKYGWVNDNCSLRWYWPTWNCRVRLSPLPNRLLVV